MSIQMKKQKQKRCSIMIRNKNDLYDFLQTDALANGRTGIKTKIFGDEIWKFIVVLRKLEYYNNKTEKKNTLLMLMLYKFWYHKLSVKLGFSIPINVFDKGLAIVHYGTIVVSKGAKIGKNWRIHEGVTIGATNHSCKAATIGNNVFIASGAKIIGDIIIADNVAIAANAVVTKSITEAGTTWGGVPAVKISDNDSSSNMVLNNI